MSALLLESFVDEARHWLDLHASRHKPSDGALEPGDAFSTAVFHSMTAEEEKKLLADLRGWNQLKAERGYHAITWPSAFGGLELSNDHARAFGRLEREYETPGRHELFTVTVRLIAPTVRQFGNEHQQREFVGRLLRTDVFCCQLFSEPGAGSDLGTLACRATRDGDQWVINGQKVWTSGARFAQWGLLIARTDPDVPKHKGLSAFLIPMDSPGVEVRAIRQMSGGSSFNEVFLTEVRVPDRLRLGAGGDGWRVALTTLGFERDHSASEALGPRPGGTWEHVLATARTLARTRDPVVRQELMKLYSHTRIEAFTNQRAAASMDPAGTPGPEGSLGKLLWTEGMTKMSHVVSMLAGPALVADGGRWGTYEWTEHVLGAPGYRIAGGSDEIQRNILAERVLGLPAEPRTDKDVPWRQLPR